MMLKNCTIWTQFLETLETLGRCFSLMQMLSYSRTLQQNSTRGARDRPTKTTIERSGHQRTTRSTVSPSTSPALRVRCRFNSTRLLWQKGSFNLAEYGHCLSPAASIGEFVCVTVCILWIQTNPFKHQSHTNPLVDAVVDQHVPFL